MFINGYSQPGATENTRLVGTDAKLLIELDGSNAGQAGTNGLSIESSNVTVRGLVINAFSGAGIEIRDATGVKIEGNFIGTYPSGTQDRSNYESGVDIFSSSFSGANNNVIGGAPRTAHNLISGNGSTGIDIFNAPDKRFWTTSSVQVRTARAPWATAQLACSSLMVTATLSGTQSSGWPTPSPSTEQTG